MIKSLLKIILTVFIPFQIVNAHDFSKIDNFILSGISNHYFPGAQLVVGNSRGIIYSESFGYIDYESDVKVTTHTLYDLASLTKVIATTTAIMKLYEEKKIDLYDVVSYYIPEFEKNGKKYIRIRNLLLHNSGLRAWIPFYQTCESKDDVINAICDETLVSEPGEVTIYSDLNAVLLGEIIERVTGMSLDDYCELEIFKPLGMNNTFFNPKDVNRNSIAPTEYDKIWRGRLLQGEVHDETAAVMGGVSGNAGLFSTAEDVAVIMQMLLNHGDYINQNSTNDNEKHFLSELTVEKFTTKELSSETSSSRAFGWDTKPEPTKWGRPCGELISENCFGHTGYTGTSVWADKDRDLFIVFLTNRVFPTRDNLGILEFRPELHNMIIELLEN